MTDTAFFERVKPHIDNILTLHNRVKALQMSPRTGHDHISRKDIQQRFCNEVFRINTLFDSMAPSHWQALNLQVDEDSLEDCVLRVNVPTAQATQHTCFVTLIAILQCALSLDCEDLPEDTRSEWASLDLPKTL